jgi:hypothetical protein
MNMESFVSASVKIERSFDRNKITQVCGYDSPELILREQIRKELKMEHIPHAQNGGQKRVQAYRKEYSL